MILEVLLIGFFSLVLIFLSLCRPLDQGAKLKDKFDEIFSATKYVCTNTVVSLVELMISLNILLDLGT